MSEQPEFDVSTIVRPEDAVIIKLNFRMDIFDQVFSKLEMINAMEYLSETVENLGIPQLHVDTITDAVLPGEGLLHYAGIKEGRRKNRTAPRSILDSGLNSDFERFLPKDGFQLKSRSGDLFHNGELLEFLEKTGRKTVMLAGFFTELEVLRTASSCLEYGYYGVTVSDATSTYSERIYYEALDLISQSTEVIDTRDLMKIWP